MSLHRRKDMAKVVLCRDVARSWNARDLLGINFPLGMDCARAGSREAWLRHMGGSSSLFRAGSRGHWLRYLAQPMV